MGTSQRRADERSPLKRFSTSCRFGSFEQFSDKWTKTCLISSPPLSRPNQQGISGPDRELPVCGVSGWTQWPGAEGYHQGPADAAWRWPWEEWGKPLVWQVNAGRTTFKALQNLYECFFCWLIHLLSVCGRNGRGVWSRVRAFTFRGNSSGSVLWIRNEIHVRQSQFCCLNECCWGQQWRKCCCCPKQNRESAQDGKGVQHQRASPSKKAALEM